MPLLALGLAALVGVSLGLLGGGGSILTLPILVYLLGFTAKQGIALSLAVVGTTAAAGAVGHWRQGNVRLGVALQFAAVAMVGTYGGARAAVHIPGTVQLALFGAVMLTAAVFMFRPRSDDAGAREEGAEGPRGHPLLLGLSALGVGLLTGIAGVGGGFLIVPALVLGVGMDMKRAVGSSLLVIALNAFVGFGSYVGNVEVPWGFLGLFTGVAILGSLAGARLGRKVSQLLLRRMFAVGLLLMGSFILYENRQVFLPTAPGAAWGAQP